MEVLVKHRNGVLYTLKSINSNNKNELMKAIENLPFNVQLVKEFKSTDNNHESDFFSLIEFLRANSLVNMLIINTWDELAISLNDRKLFEEELNSIGVDLFTLDELTQEAKVDTEYWANAN